MLGEKLNKWVPTLFKSIYFHDLFQSFMMEQVNLVYIHLINVFVEEDFHFYFRYQLLELTDLTKHTNIQKSSKVAKEKPEI